MSVVIAPITVTQMREESGQLLKDHYEELTLHKEVVKLEVDWSLYDRLEKNSNLMSLGAWDNGILVGYSVFIVKTNIHYKNLLMASNDVLFLRKDKRKGILGVRLIKESEKCLSVLGVKKLIWHVKFETVLGPLLKRLGYEDEEYTVGKILGD